MQTFFWMLLLVVKFLSKRSPWMHICIHLYCATKKWLLFSMHQPESYLLVAKQQSHRLHFQTLIKPAVIQSLIPTSWARKLPLTLWMELNTFYEKQGGDPQRTTSEKQLSWAAPSAGGLPAEIRVCLFQFFSALRNVNLLQFTLSAALFWAGWKQMKNAHPDWQCHQLRDSRHFTWSLLCWWFPPPCWIPAVGCENNSPPLCFRLKLNSVHHGFFFFEVYLACCTFSHSATISN